MLSVPPPSIFFQAMIGVAMVFFAGCVAIIGLIFHILVTLWMNYLHRGEKRSVLPQIIWLVLLLALMVCLIRASSGPQLIT